MDRALASGAEGCVFESRIPQVKRLVLQKQDQPFLFIIQLRGENTSARICMCLPLNPSVFLYHRLYFFLFESLFNTGFCRFCLFALFLRFYGFYDDVFHSQKGVCAVSFLIALIVCAYPFYYTHLTLPKNLRLLNMRV